MAIALFWALSIHPSVAGAHKCKKRMNDEMWMFWRHKQMYRFFFFIFFIFFCTFVSFPCPQNDIPSVWRILPLISGFIYFDLFYLSYLFCPYWVSHTLGKKKNEPIQTSFPLNTKWGNKTNKINEMKECFWRSINKKTRKYLIRRKRNF